MTEHLLFSEHLTAKEVHRPIADTYLGQAHIAGTGPEGKTCRECKFWCLKKFRKNALGNYEEHFVYPGYFGKKHQSNAGGLKKAKSCRLFEPAEAPPAAVKKVAADG